MNRKGTLMLRKENVIKKLPVLTEITRGTLFERAVKCGKKNCRCAKEDEGHPVWYLSVGLVGGGTEQITVPKDLVAHVREWLENYGKVLEGIEEVSAINRNLLRKRWLLEGQRATRTSKANRSKQNDSK